ncbi:dihydrofolate reductase [Paenibacillus xylanexedens]|uniref:dihydrofolate reductase n=1 Tax=Paenibacillus xylanexedens TaxID=528191 RepID=UPI000F525C0A|nr:dihydrofolate reductase [Paenibacillus xylanexedens]RPK31740.1 Dihydrofolate reductase [Paenibacillus xylanexedens]
MSKLSIIVATDKNGLIGSKGKLPWHIPWDLTYFKEKTTGANVIMGRKTYESIGKTLPNRTNVILTSNSDYNQKGCIIVNNIDDVLKLSADSHNETFIIGGSKVYEQFIPIVEDLYINEIQHTFHGDSYFPNFNGDEWDIYTEETMETTEDAEIYKIKVRHLKRK